MVESFEYTRLGGWRIVDDLYPGEESLETRLPSFGFDHQASPDIGTSDSGLRVQVFNRDKGADNVSERGHAYVVKVEVARRINIVGVPNLPDLLALLSEVTELTNTIMLNHQNKVSDTGWLKN